MSCSKPLPPFTFDLFRYLNRDQMERFSIVCRHLKNFIERYFNSKPYRVFDRLLIRGGSFALIHDNLQWHPNRDDYSVEQFLAGQKCSIDSPWRGYACHSFEEMRPYLGSIVRIKKTTICVDYTYNLEHIADMESIAYLWQDGDIHISNFYSKYSSQIVAEDFLPILHSPTILQCKKLVMDNAHFSYKDYKVLYSVKVIEIYYGINYAIDPNSWLQFLDQPGVKPLVVLRHSRCQDVDNVLNHFVKAFSSAVSPNAFKIVFAELGEELTEFRETNNISGEILALKKGLPAEYWQEDYYNYMLERSSF